MTDTPTAEELARQISRSALSSQGVYRAALYHLNAHAAQARADALEEAANHLIDEGYDDAEVYAAAIRELKRKEKSSASMKERCERE